MSDIFKELKAEANAGGEVLAGYMKSYLDLSEPDEKPKFMFSIGEKSTIPVGELIAVTGQAKVGKSQFIYYLIGIMLAGELRGSVKALHPCKKILLFDTEQSEYSVKRCCRQALRFAGLQTDRSDPRFWPFSMRKLSIEERIAAISEAIKQEHPDIVFIDGIRDLLKDFNNIEESHKVIQVLLELIEETGCTIVTVLHQNKGENTNMRGHLGTELMNKLFDCFEVEKKEGVFCVKCAISRNLPCNEIAFIIDAEDSFREANVPAEKPNVGKKKKR